MTTDVREIGAEHPLKADEDARGLTFWTLSRRIAFRFCFVYFGTYLLITQMGTLLIPGIVPPDSPGLESLWPVRQIVSWAAVRVFHVGYPLVIEGSGSGDKTFDWVEVFCILVLSVAATILWSVIDRRRRNYDRLHSWFHLLMRAGLASTMLLYGFAKAIPTQMPFPNLSRLLQSFGSFSPASVLWYSIGSSPAYETFAGCAELAAGILLLIPRTRTLGALVCLADMIQVFALNMTYDIPVKLFSLHLILFAVVILAPDIPRLMSLFVFDRDAGRSPLLELFRTARANRFAKRAQLAFLIYIVTMNVVFLYQNRQLFGRDAADPPLFGIWTVDQLSIDGQVRSPLLTDNDRWRRFVVDRARPGSAAIQFQKMDDTFIGYRGTFDEVAKTLTLAKGSDQTWKAIFNYERTGPDKLSLNGSMDGRAIKMDLQLVDHRKFMLIARGFHWIQEYPFYR
jgi:uncharacterized membrane protein YphA (DoxX/SURF4 family)